MSELKFDDYLKELYARKPSLKLDVAIAGILIDVQIKYYERLKKTPANDAVGGFDKEAAAIKALITTELEAFAAELKDIVETSERMAWLDEDGTQMHTKVFETNFNADIDRLLAERKGGR